MPEYSSPFNKALIPSIQVDSVIPQARVTFATPGGIYTYTSGDANPMMSVVSIVTSKSISQATGTFTITLVPRNIHGNLTWHDTINPMDFVVIELRGDGADPWNTVMVGFVDAVVLNESMPTGGGQRSISIQGSDFGKILERSNVDFFNHVVPVNAYDLKASVPVNGIPVYANPSVDEPPIGLFPPITWFPVIEQIPGWVQVAFGFGDAWAQSGNVQLHTINDPYIDTLIAYFKAYSLTVPLTGGISVSGLSQLLINTLSGLQNAPDALNSDPGTLMAVVMLTWIYRTFNVPIGYLGGNGQMQLAMLSDCFQFILTNTQGLVVPQALLSPMQGTIWSFMQSVSLPPLYELWLDTRSLADINGPLMASASPISQSYSQWQSYITNEVIQPNLSIKAEGVNTVSFGADQSVPVLVYRETPFDAATFATLPVHTISNHDMMSKQLTKSDSEVINLYWVYPESPPANAGIPQAYAVFYQPVVDGASASRYGMRSLHSPMLGFPLSTNSGEAFTFIEGLNEKLYTWYNKNPFYWTGTFHLAHGRPDIKIGNRLLDESSGMSYYIEQVQHTYTQFSSFTTSLTVSRGEVRP